MNHGSRLAWLGAVIGACVAAAPSAHAVVIYDLTTVGSSATINGGFFTTSFQHSTGTGTIDSFVRLKDSGPNGSGAQEQGYNTSGRPLRFDENNSPNFTRDLLLTSVPVVTIDGTLYREFLLDINQQSSNPLLSLDQVEIFVNNTGSLNPTNITTLGTLIYNMDGAGDAGVKLDYNLNSGSGSGDMFLYVPDSLFPTSIAANTQFIYLYSHFGTSFANNDGFEEWAVEKVTNPPCEQLRTCSPPPPPPTIPEPASMMLFGLGALGAGLARRRSA